MASRQQRILITGGAGFIGSRLAAAWRAGGHAVHVLDNFLPQVHEGNPENRARLDDVGARVIEGDIRDGDAVARAVAESDPTVVYHLAAETGTGQSFDEPVRYVSVNVTGTAHLIEAIRANGANVRRVVLAGSRSVYGEGACVDADGRPTVAAERTDADMEAGRFEPRDADGAVLRPVPTDGNCEPRPASIYASSKLMQEHMLLQGFWGTPVDVGILRLQNVYGVGQSLNNPYTGVLSIFTRQVIEGRTLDIYEDGEITRDFVHVDDVVEAFRLMGERDTVPAGVVDIGSGEPATILDVARTLLGLLEQPRDKLRITGAFRPGDIRYAVADTARARAELEWRPGKSLEDGLRELVEWSKATLAETATSGRAS